MGEGSKELRVQEGGSDPCKGKGVLNSPESTDRGREMGIAHGEQKAAWVKGVGKKESPSTLGKTNGEASSVGVEIGSDLDPNGSNLTGSRVMG